MTPTRPRAHLALSLCVAALSVAGCSTPNHAVLAATGTTIGVELGTQAGTNAPTSVLGYRRAEFAHVPAMAASGTTTPSVPDVMMELSYGGVFQSDGRIYQRLAIGANAVKGSAAATMFSRTVDGRIQSAASAATEINAGQVELITACVSTGKDIRRAALAGVLDAATADAGTKAAVAGHANTLRADTLTLDQLRQTLLLSDGLAEALAKHAAGEACKRS